MRKLKLVILRLARSLGLFAAARWYTRDALKILCYHGFASDDEAEFRSLLFIRVELFQQRMDRLKQLGYCVLPLDEAVARLYSGTLPPDSVVITIDDGFDATRTLAAPVLAKLGLPATVYVTSYYVERNAPVFGLVVQYLFWKTRKAILSIRQQPWLADADVNIEDRSIRLRVQDELISYGERSTETERRALTVWLADALEVDLEAIERARKLHLMSPQQLAELQGLGISVQLHTHRHRCPIDDETVVREEVLANRAALSRWCAGPFEHFCYPSGVWHARQSAWLDSVGVKSSTTCLPGFNKSSTPRHALRRFLDGQNLHELEFESALCGFWDLVRPVR